MLTVDERHELTVREHSATWWLADSDSHFFRVEIVTPDGKSLRGRIGHQSSLELDVGHGPMDETALVDLESALWAEFDRVSSQPGPDR